MNSLVDPFGRKIDYLRVSLTDRCNFRCVYCMPEEGLPPLTKEEVLTTAELMRIIGIAAAAGMRKIRFTGGEPLLKGDLPLVIESAARAGFTDISATTNGYLLKSRAKALKQAGLQRINVSLDTLDHGRFKEIARRGELDAVLAGIEEAARVGLSPIKINCVLMKGVNDREVGAFAALSRDQDLHVRFIELMPMRWNLDETPAMPFAEPLLQLKQATGGMLDDLQMRRMFFSAADAKAQIESELGELEPAEVVTNGPARTYRLKNAVGTVGFISQITNDFCSRCNRIRLTHDGFLRPCLMSDGELDLRTPIRAGADDQTILELLRSVVAHKPERHYLAEGQKVVGRSMSQIGG